MTDTHFCLDDSPWFKMIELDEVTSTNDFLRGYQPREERRMTLVTAEYQTAGRGAGENHWESERDKNLTFSLLTHPRHIPVEQIFVLSEVLALAVQQGVEDFVRLEFNNGEKTMGQREFNSHFRIKWPNDIYYGDRKLCGMLIENNIKGTTLQNCVMGVGINVNQTTFSESLPNPVSLAQILGMEVERRFVLERVMQHFTRLYDWTEQGHKEEIHQMYLSRLYRKDEKHCFVDGTGTFEGTIIDVELSGHLVVRDEKGTKKRYAFKEVEYVIN